MRSGKSNFKKVVVFGSTGMLGHLLYNYLKLNSNYELYDLSYRKKLSPNTIIIDAKDKNQIKNFLQSIRPDIIVNCIGLLIEESEKDIKSAIYLNAYFPQWLKGICDNINCKLIHISTDCVFNGEKGNYNENSIKNATDIYGKTKSLGEFDSINHLCLRTSIIGPEIKSNGKGLFHWLFNQKGMIFGYKNVFWSGITTLELSKAIHYSIEKNVVGLWNITNGKPISKFNLLEKIINNFYLKGIKISPEFQKTSDKSLKSIRKINFSVSSYDSMLDELREYLKNNKNLYSYNF